jgi:hypothetical protein
MDATDCVSCSVAGFDFSDVETSGSITAALIN